MVAVLLALKNTFGLQVAFSSARWSTLAHAILDASMAFLFAAAYLQSRDYPAKLMIA
jgi:RsiW-degrading membrane proteinase PrsW (M82 family)